jgi:hypothetical protein
MPAVRDQLALVRARHEEPPTPSRPDLLGRRGSGAVLSTLNLIALSRWWF